MKKTLALLIGAIVVFVPEALAEIPVSYLVKDIYPGSTGSISDLAGPTTLGDTVFFTASDGTHGNELWKSDGTTTGTVLVKDIRSGSSGSEPLSPSVVGNTLYFRASDGSHGSELWKSDGTASGTTLIKDINGNSGSYPVPQCAVGNTLYFSAYTDLSGTELWKTDGTSSGTNIVIDITPGTGSTTLNPGVAIGSTYYFTAKHPTLGSELWRTDGTPTGTYVVKDISPASAITTPSGLCVAGNILYFVADDGVHGRELWRSDGSTAGTVMVKDIAPGTTSGTNSKGMTAANGLIYFQARTTSEAVNWGIWRSNGTPSGTFPLLTTATLYSNFSYSNSIFAVGSEVLFQLKAAGEPFEIWKSNGTVAGTVPLESGLTASIDYVFPVGTGFYFGSRNGEFRQSDGTLEGTYLVANLSAGRNFHLLPALSAGRVCLGTNSELTGTELYAYDITPPSIAEAEINERTKTSAIINLAVNPNGFSTTAKLEYGQTDSYGATVNLPVNSSGNKSLFQSFSIPLTDLTIGTTYHYRITATSTKGDRVSTGTFDTVYTREDWRLAHFGTTQNSGVAADDQDPDHDGLSNLVEYGFGLNPWKSDPGGLPTQRLEYYTSVHEFTQAPGIEDVVYGVEWSRTMKPGSWIAAQDEVSGNHHIFKVRIYSGGTFMRWKLTAR